MKNIVEEVKMSKENKENKQLPPIVVNSQYVKDFSLEIPHAPQIFKKLNNQPKVNMNVEVRPEHLEENVFNVSLNFSIEGKIEDDVLFVVELVYAGVVSLNVPKEHMDPVLMVEIPRILFPFARSIITNSMIDAGLPPFMINPIDFGALYTARQKKQGMN